MELLLLLTVWLFLLLHCLLLLLLLWGVGVQLLHILCPVICIISVVLTFLP